MWACASLVSAIALLSSISASAGLIVRGPTPQERATLQQAVFDYYFTNTLLSRVDLTSIRVEVLPPSPVRSRLVTKYAVIGTHGFDTSGQDVGYQRALAVFFSSPMRGWRVFSSGSSNVGCAMPKWYPSGQERAILKALRMRCGP